MNKPQKLSRELIEFIEKCSFLFNLVPAFLWKHKFNTGLSLDDDKKSLVEILQKLNLGDYELSLSEINCLKKYDINTDSLVSFLSAHRKKIINIIKKKINKKDKLTEIDLQILENLNVFDLLEVYKQHLQEKYSNFLSLNDHIDKPCYYRILQKIESRLSLTSNDINWLNSNNITDVLAFGELLDLAIKYKARLNNDSINTISFLSSNLYRVLNKIDDNIPLNQNDLNFLKNEILLIEEWQNLKRKYEIEDNSEFVHTSKLLFILQKLNNSQRLDAADIVYLEDKRLFYTNTKIYKTYHQIEAEFYEAEYKENKNLWSLPNISSHWRKADRSKKALQSTDNINFDAIKDRKLKSAILTTRGGAFRDIDKLDSAEKCARQAIKFQLSSYHPYTLMGAIYFDRGKSYEGHRWFEEAEKRGAPPDSIDTEIKKSINKMKDKDKRNQIIRDLLKRDKHRYHWAKRYLLKKDR